MILIDTLPSSIELGGKEYRINTDFRYWILFEMLMQDNEISEIKKIEKAIDLFFENEIPLDVDFKECVDAMMWFYSCGEINSKTDGKVNNKKINIYDFEVDADYIFSAFLSQYNIDLNIESIHWWKFKALFKSLKSDNEIVKIMLYRSIEITSDMTKEEQRFYKEMKEIYALDDKRCEYEKEKDFYLGFSTMF